MNETITQYRVVCACGDLILAETESRAEVHRVMLEAPRVGGCAPKVEVRVVRITPWSQPDYPISDFRRTPEQWLYKRPAGDTIHRANCSRAPDARHWIWADDVPDEIVLRWIKPNLYSLCSRCKPLEGVS